MEVQLTKHELVQNDDSSSSLLSREWQAIGLGLRDGVSKLGTQTGSDIKAGAASFIESPISTGADYLSKHWQDAAFGAAITFLKPNRWANAALIAYSLKGVGTATYETAIAALDPRADLNSLRKNYAEAMSHEGSAFLATMPMAMLGGNIGRAGANAVFGKNLGALDLISGKVKVSEVKSNLWELHDSIRPPAVKLVITDMDNTLASHSRYFARGVEKAISELSAKTRIPESELYTSIGRQMENYRSHDYPWSVELALSERLKVGKPGGLNIEEFHSKIVRPFWNTIDNSLIENYKPFETVHNTLKELRKREIPVAVLSDAPAFIGLQRLKNLGFDDGLVQRFYGLHNWTTPKGLSAELMKEGHSRVSSMLESKHSLAEFRAMPAHWEKPETSGFQALIRQYNVRPKETLMIGDSRVKDVGVAHRSGARAIWAEYGGASAAEEAILTRLRPLPENGGGVIKDAGPKKYAPYLEAADSYASVLKHLNPRADYLNLATQSLKSVYLRPQLKSAVAAFGLIPKSVEDSGSESKTQN